MPRLPFEISKTIFCQLETSDLLQCQLTCKEWYTASVELLYSTPKIDTDTKSEQYVRTIKNSSSLGRYLKTIDTDLLFWEDEYKLLDTIIQKCPIAIKPRNSGLKFRLQQTKVD